jgi:hypothetical protein
MAGAVQLSFRTIHLLQSTYRTIFHKHYPENDAAQTENGYQDGKRMKTKAESKRMLGFSVGHQQINSF